MNNPGGSIGSSDGSHSLEPSHPPDEDEGGIPHNLSDPQLAPQDDDEPQEIDDNIMEEDPGEDTGAAAITTHDNNAQQALNNLPIENSGTQPSSSNTTQPRQPSTSIKDSKLTIQLPSTLPSSSQQTQNQNSSYYTDTVINGESMNNLAMNSPCIKTQLLPQIQEGGLSSIGGFGMLPHQKLSTGGREGGREEEEQTSGEKSIEISSRSNHTLGSQGRVNRGGGFSMDAPSSDNTRIEVGGLSMSIVDSSRIDSQTIGGQYRANTPGDMSLSSEISVSTTAAAMTQQHNQQQQPVGMISTGRYGSPAIEGTSTTTTGGIKTQEDDNNTPGGNEATAAHERRQSGKLSPRVTASQSNDNTNRIKGGRGMITSNIRGPNMTLERLSYILGRGSLIMINFSQRNLSSADAPLIKSAIISNPQLSVLKLGYNNLGNVGAKLIAEAICTGGGSCVGNGGKEKQMLKGDSQHQQQQQQQQHKHHPSLSVLDLGFNNIGNEGCTSLAQLAVASNSQLSTLYLSGNAINEQGSLSLANVITKGCGLTSLHLTANNIGSRGVKGLMRSIAEFDVTVQMARQDYENRMALEEEEEVGKKKRMEKEENGLLKSEEEKNVDDDVDLESLGINSDEGKEEEQVKEDNATANNSDGGSSPADDLSRLKGYKCLEELYLGGTHMGSTGCLSVSNMLLTNLSLRVICLSDNGLNDQDLSLFSQSLSRNRELPLETLRLSFNKLTCVGVETLMNAIWGSKTLREIKLDNNQIRDRGAQLAAVVLTSVDLEVLDMGFNRLTIVGIKALMKSLAENRSLQTLTLSGNVLDTNASKAVSYALAYNKTIRKLYVDHCSLSYAAQRHIAAGIVSNSNLALRVMSGFPLGAISVTLGLPGAMETWSNEQVLKFIRVMWDRYQHEKEAALLASSKDSTQSMSTMGGMSEASATAASEKSAEKPEPKIGPSDPATVVAAAKSAFEALGDAGGALLLTEEPQRAISESSPMVSSDAVMLEKTPSGTIRVPSLDETDEESSRQSSYHKPVPLEVSTLHTSTDTLCTANGKDCPETPVDPAAKKRNMDWLRQHFRSLNEMIQLPYVYADLIQLYRYFYSPADADDDSSSAHDGMPPPQLGIGPNISSSPPQRTSGLQRKISYRGLHDVMMGQSSTLLSASPNFSAENSSKRRSVSDQLVQPATKRARSGKPRIDYFPRLKVKIELYLSSSKQTKALILLRQLKFVETTMFHGVNPYCDQSSTTGSMSSEPIATDAEVILIDML